MVAVAIGVAILVAFGGFIVYMMRNLDIPDNEWTRATFPFGGVEAATKVAQRADEAVESERTSTAMLAEGILPRRPGWAAWPRTRTWHPTRGVLDVMRFGGEIGHM